VGVLIFLLGLYLVLRIAGLTRLALTLLGGTGLLGLVIGIAFSDITENVLASILLSVQRPFRVGDLVDIAGVVGYVQQLNVRTTVLMALSGNHVQIPNATVYKSIIRNYTSNPNRREDFTIGIGYEVGILDAQTVALQVLAAHPAILQEPEPWVLVDSLGPTTVNLRIYFWLDGSHHSWLKVKSSVIRLVKRAFQEQGISMPDEAREVILPQGVAVHLVDGPPHDAGTSRERSPAAQEPHVIATPAEGGLQTEAEQLEAQARQARQPEAGENLLQASPPAHSAPRV
jgi:small-conductance mechanosensitive channel